jgi:5-methylcytosine-specific restriction protein A
MNKPCMVCGTPTPKARCPQHQLPKRPKPAPKERGYDERWRRISKMARILWPYCNQCGATEDLTCDHLRPGKVVESLNDVQVLCRRCNSRKGAPGDAEEPPNGGGFPTRPFRQKNALRGPL